MQTVTVEYLITLLTPIFSGIICFVLVLLHFPVWAKQKGTGMRQALISYYVLTTVNWFMLMLLAFFPVEFTYIRPLFVYTTLLVFIALYQFIFVLTRTDSREKFSKLHYVLPVVIFLVYLIWSWSVPREVMLQTSLYTTQSVAGYETFYTLLSLAAPIRLMFGLGYYVLCVLRYRRFRHMVGNYASDLHQNSLYWLRIFLILWLSFLIVPVLVVSFETFQGQLQLFIQAALLSAQHILLVFYVVRETYVLIKDDKNDAVINSEDRFPEHKNPLEPSVFEQYIKEQKPYLRPDLTIIDMAARLYVNRSYLSTFINKVYRMSFSQFINECRLQELDHIVANPDNASKTNMEKIVSAGFGSYQSYKRALKMHEERKTLSADGK